MDWKNLPPLLDMDLFGKLVPTIGKNKRYELVRSEGFPAKKLGNKILIHRDGLKRWLDKEFGLVDEESDGKLRLIK